jgi:nicotinamide-nucleotide amidase
MRWAMKPEEELGELLRTKSMTLAVAESCTGGLVSDMITNVPGSSLYFLAGLVTYSNDSKIEFLGVSRETLESHGAVSEQVAIEMARGARKAAGADIGAAVTGIAGPGGGTEQKPVGLVYFAVDDGRAILTDRAFLSGDRREVKRSSSQRLIEIIVKSLRE